MTSAVLWLIAWLVCAPTTYMLVRADTRKTFGKWTQFDRVIWAVLSTLFGPYIFLGIFFSGLVLKIACADWADREASW